MKFVKCFKISICAIVMLLIFFPIKIVLMIIGIIDILCEGLDSVIIKCMDKMNHWVTKS